ncbi:hypothetical protein RUM43_011158, partial [Polyplax serrata]
SPSLVFQSIKLRFLTIASTHGKMVTGRMIHGECFHFERHADLTHPDAVQRQISCSNIIVLAARRHAAYAP